MVVRRDVSRRRASRRGRVRDAVRFAPWAGAGGGAAVRGCVATRSPVVPSPSAQIAPKTARLVSDLGSVGAYTSNHIFRVDKGFVAQTAGVIGGRTVPLDAQQTRLASMTVPLEVDPEVKHDRRGILSLARNDDPNSGGSSFSILLGPAPHLDMQYAIFGEVTKGLETLTKLEQLPTRREGIFVMPLERIEILASYVYVIPEGQSEEAGFQTITTYARGMEDTYQAAVAMVDRIKHTQLPGHQGIR